MPIKAEKVYPSGQTLLVGFVRSSDGLAYDFANLDFRASPTTRRQQMTQDPSDPGCYSYSVASTPVSVWANGKYQARYYDADLGYVVDAAPFDMQDGESVFSPLPLAEGTVASVSGGSLVLTATGLKPVPGLYNGMQLLVTSGALRGGKRAIATHTFSAGSHTITLAAALPTGLAVGDRFTIG